MELTGRFEDDERFFDDSDAEDVHSFIEGKLIAMIGDTGRKASYRTQP